MKRKRRGLIFGIAAAVVLAGAAAIFFALIQPMLKQGAASEAALAELSRQAENTPEPIATPVLPAPTPLGPYRERVIRHYSKNGVLTLEEVYDYNGLLLLKESDDERLEYTYDEAGNLVTYYKYSGPDKIFTDRIDYHYDAQGRETEKIDYGVSNGKAEIWEQYSTRYDEYGNESSYETRSADGTLKESHVYTYTYDDAGHVLKCVYVYSDPPDGTATETTTNKYDQNGNLISTSCVCRTDLDYVSPYSYQTRYEYDEQNRCVKEIDLNQGAVDGYEVYTYDENGIRRKSTRYSADDERLWVTEYDENGERIEEDDTEYEYDENGVLIHSYEEYSSTEIRQTDYYYDEYGRLVREESARVGKEGETAERISLGYCEYEYVYE